jgi:hypothetical protein
MSEIAISSRTTVEYLKLGTLSMSISRIHGPGLCGDRSKFWGYIQTSDTFTSLMLIKNTRYC